MNENSWVLPYIGAVVLFLAVGAESVAMGGYYLDLLDGEYPKGSAAASRNQRDYHKVLAVCVLSVLVGSLLRVAASNDRSGIGYQLGQEESLRFHLAATAMRGQPFGFTWYDVDALREAAKPFWETADTHGPGPAPTLANLADRIAALLPPRAEAPPPPEAPKGR